VFAGDEVDPGALDGWNVVADASLVGIGDGGRRRLAGRVSASNRKYHFEKFNLIMLLS
jgi:hypothetical protein